MGDRDVFQLPDGTRIVYTYDLNRGGAHLNRFDVTAPDGRVSILNTPLALDLKGRGIRTVPGSVTYDIAGTGMREQIAALPADIGVLAFDAGHTGVPGQDGRGLFGNNTDLDGKGRPGGYTDGFEALAAFVARAERAGKIPAGTAAAGRLDSAALAALERAYGLRLLLGGVKGRAVTLREAGVGALLLSTASSRRTQNFDGRGDALSTRAGAVFERVGGGNGRYVDIWFATQHPLPQRFPLLRTFLPAPVAK